MNNSMNKASKVGCILATTALCAYTIMPVVGIGGGPGPVKLAQAEEDTAAQTLTSDNGNVSQRIDDLIDTSETSDASVTKDETVYVFTQTDGTQKNIIVTDWLKNNDGVSNISDSSSLSDIENTETNQSYTDNGNGSLSWSADGGDIYYKGTSNEQAPVDMKITYYLDGEEISPDDLAGKSGKVTIHIEFTNNSFSYKDVNGEQTKIYTPFTVMTGVVLDNSNFSNVTVSSGKVFNDGDRTVVAGVCFPGMQDNLGVDKDVVDMPSYVEITADATDFKLDTIMAAASSNMFGNVDSEDIDLSDVDSALNSLTSAMNKLMSGSNELVTGLDQLAAGATAIDSGAQQLAAGANQLSSGTSELQSGASALSGGIDQLNSGAASLYNGLTGIESTYLNTQTGSLYLGSASVAGGAQQISAGIGTTGTVGDQTTIAGGVATLDYALNTNDGSGSGNPLTTDAASVATGASAVSGGISQMAGSVSTLATSASTLNTSISNLSDAASNTANYVGDAQADLQTLVNNGTLTAEQASQLSADLGYANAYATTVSDGMGQVSTGMGEVSRGISQLNTVLNENDGSGNSLKADAASVATGASGISSGIGTIASGVANLNKVLNVNDGSGNPMTTDAASLASGAVQVRDGIGALDTAFNTQLIPGAQRLSNGVQTLANSSPALVNGINQINSGASQLSSGASTLAGNTPALASGAQSAASGAKELSSGLSQFNEQGVQKIVDAYEGNIGTLTSRVGAILDAGNEYDNFSGLGDGMDGNVKFIYETDPIGE